MYLLPSQRKFGFTRIELLVLLVIIGAFAHLLMSVNIVGGRPDPRERDRMKCLNNLRQVGRAMMVFANDNDDRFPWQLTPLSQMEYFGSQTARSVETICSLKAIKSELVTPKILASPCDPEVQDSNEKAQYLWESYDTKAGKLIPCSAISYRFIDGANTGWPGTMLASTRNLSTLDLSTARWLGADEPNVDGDAITGLNKGEGNAVYADGSTRLVNDKGIGDTVKYHRNFAGGIEDGPAPTGVIGCSEK